MVQPAANSISASASRNGRPRRAARRRPIEVLPAPISPTSTMLRPASASGNGTVSFMAVLRVMAADASTPGAGQAKAQQESVEQAMIRIFLIVVAVGVVILGATVVFLGAYPPDPKPRSVEKVLPNDKFQSR